MIVAVMLTFDEADIIEASVRYLFAQGIDRLLVADAMSTDGTRDVLHDLPFDIDIRDDPEPFCYQQTLTTRLAHDAYMQGATWVIPIDADEFWTATTGTVAEACRRQPLSVRKLFAPMYQYHDWDRRERHPKPHPKVAFRATPNVELAAGNHDCSLPGGRRGVLTVREIQYRNFEHFVRKTKQRIATIDPTQPAGYGGHHARYRDWTLDQMRTEWDRMQKVATVWDPIGRSVSSSPSTDPRGISQHASSR